MGVPEDVEDARPTAPAPAPAEMSFFRRWVLGPGRREATSRMGLGQAAYILGFHGFGSLVISGGVNFGIACGEYPFLIPRLHPLFHTRFYLGFWVGCLDADDAFRFGVRRLSRGLY